MASSYEGNWLDDQMTNNHSSLDYSDSDEFEMNNALLLLIIIGLCALIMIMLLFVFLYICCRSSNQKSSHSTTDVRILLLSKATSITGLCDDTNSNVIQVCEESHSDINFISKPAGASEKKLLKSSQNNVMTSPPDGKLENKEMPSCSENLIQNKDESEESSLNCNGTSNESEHLLSTAESSCNLVSLPLTPNTDNSIYATANSIKLDGPHTTEDLAQYLIDDLKVQTEKEVDDLLPASELSPLNSAKISKSMPLDVHGHPRAWFVPLDKVYHEPIRHSYIDMCKQHSASPNEKSLEESSLVPSGNSGLRLNLSALNGKENGCDDFGQHGSEGSLSWRDSGIPQSSLGRYNSSDFDKKPSVWEQREDRPVVFLENPDNPSISPRSLE